MIDNTKVRLGIAAPQAHLRLPLDLDMVQAYVQRAEALGFDSLWVQEQFRLTGGVHPLESVSMLSYAAALTRRIRLGGAVFLVALRNPIELARSLATVDQLSAGRVIAGVGLGGVRQLYATYGFSADRLVTRYEEALTLLERLWTEEDLNFNGAFWKLEHANLLPKPVQKPHPPIWFGAHAPAALRRAARLGSGFIGAGSASTATFANEVEFLTRVLAATDKDPDAFMMGKRVYLAVDSNRERARARLREWFGLFYGKPEMADTVAIIGDAAECAEKLRKIVDAGAQFLLLNPVYDMMEQLEILADEVAPRI